ncbi:MAG: DUF1802 family protein [Candidatus Methylomirabilales bacterium]
MSAALVRAALKEWAVVCRALRDGRQTLLIRKGGILEVKRGFEVVHREFWLVPTYVHQSARDLVPEVEAEFGEAQASQPTDGFLDLDLYAQVTDEVKVTDLDRLQALAGLHVLSANCVASRFHYRSRPGAHVLVLRVFRRPAPVRVPNTPGYDGCISWVELDQPLDTEGLTPVLPAAAFEARRREVLDRLAAAPAPSAPR